MSDLYPVEEKLWDAADKLRANTHLRSYEYSMPLLGLIFLKFVSQKFVEVEHKLKENNRPVTPARVKAEGAIYLDTKARFDYLRGLSENLGEAINEAMRLIEHNNIESLSNSLPTNAYTAIDDAVLKSLLESFDSLSLDIEGDIFGKIYEYFLAKIALAEGQRGGMFFTPASIVKLIVEIIEPYQGRILDPACGSGGMFVQSARFVQRHKRNFAAEASIYGQEKAQETVKLCKMNLAVHSLSGDIRNGNSYDEMPFEEKQDNSGFDFVVSNPPFNVSGIDKNHLLNANKRFPFGLPRTDNANYLWIQLFYSLLNEKGRAGFVMPNSASDAHASEQEIRRQLLEQGVVDVMVALGPNFFYTVTLPCTLWFLDKGKRKGERRDEVLFIDARNIYQQVNRAHREFKTEQLEFLANIVHLYRGESVENKNGNTALMAKMFPNGIYIDIPGLCKVATLDDIATQNWSLNPGRYIEANLGHTIDEPPIIISPPILPKVNLDNRKTVFICYHHEDKKALNRLHTHLAPLRRNYEIDIWDNTRISAGEVRREEVLNAIARTRVAVLLISANFLASDFIVQDELPRLLEMAKMQGASIIPVLLSPCLYEETLLANFQLANGKPLSGMYRWHEREETWVEIVKIAKKKMRL